MNIMRDLYGELEVSSGNEISTGSFEIDEMGSKYISIFCDVLNSKVC